MALHRPFFLVFFLVWPLAWVQAEVPPPLGAEGPFPVEQVYDGDTYQIRGQRVRLLYVDTEESHHHDPKRNSPFGRRTTLWAQQEMAQAQVMLSCLPQRDRYQRRLCLLWRKQGQSWSLFNLELVRQGWSRYATWWSKPPRPYFAQFKAAQDQARQAKRGVWNKARNRQPP